MFERARERGFTYATDADNRNQFSHRLILSNRESEFCTTQIIDCRNAIYRHEDGNQNSFKVQLPEYMDGNCEEAIVTYVVAFHIQVRKYITSHVLNINIGRAGRLDCGLFPRV
jgi:hypothetical protein